LVLVACGGTDGTGGSPADSGDESSEAPDGRAEASGSSSGSDASSGSGSSSGSSSSSSGSSSSSSSSSSGSSGSGGDAGADASADAGEDAGTDTGADAATDSGDAGTDADDAGGSLDSAADASDATVTPDAGDAGGSLDAAPDASDATVTPDAGDAGGSLDSATADSAPVDASDGAANEAGGAPGDDPCTSPDPGNSDPSHPSLYVLGTTFNGCIRSGSDTDYIAFTTPSNPAGGYVVASFTAPGLYQSALTVDSYLYLANNTMIAYDAFEMSAAHPGDSLTYWFAAAPSTTYVLRVVDVFGMTFLAPYTFNATFTPVVDPTKPNDSEATATMVTPGTPVQSYDFHGYTSYNNSSDIGWWSFYEVDLAAKPATVQITNVPAELTMEAYVFGNYGAGEASILGYGSGGANGASVMLSTNQPFNAGPHYIRVEAVFNPHAYGTGATPASYVLHPYTLVVTQ
jgi:hypothetical protein